MSKMRVAISILSLSAIGLVGLVSSEGYTDRAVIPVKGDVPTIGFGSTTRQDGSPVKLGDVTTPPKALARALKDISTYEAKFKRCVQVPLTQGEYDLFIDHMYNVGPAAFCTSTMAKNLNAQDYAGACREFTQWRFFHGKDCSLDANKKLCGGLWTRRVEARNKCLDEQKP